MLHHQGGWSEAPGEEEAHSTTVGGVVAQSHLPFPLFLPLRIVVSITVDPL